MSEFHDQDYTPPKVAVVVGAILRKPREVGHSVQISDLFSSVQEQRDSYFGGLSAVPIIFFSLFLGWMFVTILLKYKGAEVGCASGRAFVGVRSYDEDEEKPEEDLGSTSESSAADTVGESSVKPIFVGQEGSPIKHSDSDLIDANDGFGKKVLRWLRQKNEKAEKEGAEINRLERKTRISFLIFASLALVCAPLCIVLTFGPLRDVAVEMSTTESSDGVFLKIENVIGDVQMSLETIRSLSADVIELIENVPTDLDTVCPLVNTTDFESIIGVDLTEIVETIIHQQDNLEDEINAQLSKKQSYVDGIEDRFSTIETFADKYDNFLWILPGLLLFIIGLTVTSIAGVILAWKEKSGSRFQRTLSYCVLPLLILVAIACWLVVMVFALSTMVGTDICLSASFDGSPDQTIQEILSSAGNGTEDGLHHFASTYIIDCEASDPSEDIRRIKLNTQEHIDNIWRQVSKIDSVGRVMTIETCGNAEEFSKMLSGARDLAMILTDIRRALSSIEESCDCESIHPIYVEASQDVVCTQTLSASSYGFVTFLIMWICVMAMISLRASWLRNSTEEEKNYHDENEVAENMVVDEHEEYLAYISKYKHEWQEYEGFEEDGVIAAASPTSGDFHHNLRQEESEDSDQRYYYGDNEEEIVFDSKSDVSTLDSRTYCSTDYKTQQEGAAQYSSECEPHREHSDIYQRKLTTREIMDHHEDGVSYTSGAISFDSLSSEIKNDVLNLDNILVLPPPLNPEYSSAPLNPEYSSKRAEQQRNADAAADLSEESDADFSEEFEKIISADLQVNEDEVEVQLYDL